MADATARMKSPSRGKQTREALARARRAPMVCLSLFA